MKMIARNGGFLENAVFGGELGGAFPISHLPLDGSRAHVLTSTSRARAAQEIYDRDHCPGGIPDPVPTHKRSTAGLLQRAGDNISDLPSVETVHELHNNRRHRQEKQLRPL
jgi:hypothetical protein